MKIVARFERISYHRFVLLLEHVLSFLSKKSDAFPFNILCTENPSAKCSGEKRHYLGNAFFIVDFY